MSRIITVSIAVSLSVAAARSDSDEDATLFPVEVPAGIEYIRPTREDARAARAALEKWFVSGGGDVAFGDAVSFGAADDNTPVRQVSGTRREVDALEKFLREKLASNGMAKVAPPSSQDLEKWAMSNPSPPGGLPMFVVENRDARYLFQFSGGSVTRIIDLGDPPTR